MKAALFEAVLSTAERKDLRKNQFGLPDKRKYPLTDEAHVKSAISYFYKCPEEDRHELAKNIERAAKRYNVEISEDSEVAKYLHKATEESFLSYVTEMTSAIEYSDAHIVMEQGKIKGFLTSLREGIMRGLTSIGRIISKIASWISDKVIKLYQRITKTGPEYIEVPKVFNVLSEVLPMADSVSVEVASAIEIFVKLTNEMVANANNPKFVQSVAERQNPWNNQKLAFMKEANIIRNKTDLSVSNKMVQDTIRIKRSDVERMQSNAKKTIDNLNKTSDRVSNHARNFTAIWNKMNKMYNGILEYEVRRAFGQFANSGQELISEGLKCLSISNQSIQKIMQLTSLSILKDTSSED